MIRNGWLALGLMILCLPCATQAQTQASSTFATVVRVRGDIGVSAANGDRRPLGEGTQVAAGEEIQSAATGEALLRTADGGMLAVRPNTRFLADAYVAEGKSTDRQILRLVAGAIRVVTGWIGSVNRAEHKVITPTATIGIRGTDHEVYVLTKEMAGEAYRSGTYDKVNRGGTTLEASGGSVDIDPGKAGFVRDPALRTRALMTLLMPVLLDRVPDFFVAGSFDQEVDAYSQIAEGESKQSLARQASPAAVPETVAAEQPAPPAAPPLAAGECDPRIVATYWLDRFDAAIVRRDSAAIIAMMAPEIRATARVRSGNDFTAVEFDRNELVASTIAAIAGVKDFRQRRTSLEASPEEATDGNRCARIAVRSLAVEQGVMNGKPYHVEALEEYVLEQRDGAWLAVRAATTQR